MSKVADVFWEISRNPLEYLPEPSLRALRYFLSGYIARMMTEGEDDGRDLDYRGFQAWLDAHFSIRAGPRSVYLAVESYSAGQEDAFRNFYRLYEEFQRSLNPVSTDSNHNHGRRPRTDLVEWLRRVRYLPPLYLGHANFFGIHAYIAGHERAGRDLGLPKTQDEELFDRFKLWIEQEKLPEGSPRPWFKRIGFCAFHDCGESKGSAYGVFYEFLDEFATKIGKPGLFEPLARHEVYKP